MILGGVLSPLENVLTDVLVWLHETGGLTWAWSIVALTVIVRVLLVPVAIRQIHSMQSLQIHAPEMKKIQQQYKNDRQRQSEELMKFYKENKINPYASCLPIVFQIPIFIGLFFVLRDFKKEIFCTRGDLCETVNGKLEVLPQFQSLLEWLEPREHHRADEGRMGTGADRRLRREPADLDVPHVDRDAEQGAALHDHVPPDRLSAVHPQLPVRADDLLADHEPVDDGAGDHHATAHAEARGSTQALEPNAAEGGGGAVDQRRAGAEHRRRDRHALDAVRHGASRRSVAEGGAR